APPRILGCFGGRPGRLGFKAIGIRNRHRRFDVIGPLDAPGEEAERAQQPTGPPSALHPSNSFIRSRGSRLRVAGTASESLVREEMRSGNWGISRDDYG